MSLGSFSLGSMNPFAGSADPASVEDRLVIDESQSELRLVARALPPEYQPMTDVERVWVDFTPRGLIVRADAIAGALGTHSMVLHSANQARPDADGDVLYQIFAVPAAAPAGDASQSARRLSAGAFLPNARLGDIRSVTVAGTGNSRTIRLR